MNTNAGCKVSVSIITYNHREYIAQAIESALMQETDFEYEIVIGEDDSSDGTREIVLAYQERYPDKIRLFLNDRENVIYIDGKPTGRWNLINNLRHARGQYVAWLEGDDYWTSPYKLQRQVDFMDAHPDYAFCFHEVMHYYEDENQRMMRPNRNLSKEIYTLEDLLKDNFVASCSVVFRNRLFGEFPDWYYTVAMGDWPLHILNAQYGTVGYIDEVMAVHRIHDSGIWSSRNATNLLRALIFFLETLQHHLSPEYSQILNDSIAQRHVRLVRALVLAGDFEGARVHLSNLIMQRPVPLKFLPKVTVRVIGRDIKRLGRRITRDFIWRNES